MLSRDDRPDLLPQHELHSAILSTVSDAVIATDRTMRVVSWNEAARRMYGWAEEEVLGRILDEVLQTRFLTATQTEAQRILLESGYWSGQVEQVTRDGMSFTVDARVSLLMTPGGDAIGGVTVNRDATEHHRALESLRDERDLNRRIADISPVGIVRVGCDGSVIYANERARGILGLKADQTVPVFNDPVWESSTFAGEPVTTGDLPLSIVKCTGTPVYDVHHKVRRPDGEYRFLTIHGVPLKDRDGAVLQMIAVIEDITDEYLLHRVLEIQRDMLVKVGSANTSVEAARIALEATGKLDGIECGAVYLRTDHGHGDELEMVAAEGIDMADLAPLSRIRLHTPFFRAMVARPAPHYESFMKILVRAGVDKEFGLRLPEMHGAAIVPIISDGKILGTMHVASCSREEIPPLTREFLEQLSSWFGDILAKKAYQQELVAAEQKLRAQTEALTEANTALKVVLRTQREEQDSWLCAIREQFERRLRPLITRLRETPLASNDGGLIDVIEIELESLVRTSGEHPGTVARFSELTPRETQVAALIRSDHTTKEIADRLSISPDAVAFHRKRIRQKLGITGTGRNLRQFLTS
jgi:PAS domain S-box-containing protein